MTSYEIKCDVCERVLGHSSQPQKGFSCGSALGTHLDGSPIKEIVREEPVDVETLILELTKIRNALLKKQLITEEDISSEKT